MAYDDGDSSPSDSGEESILHCGPSELAGPGALEEGPRPPSFTPVEGYPTSLLKREGSHDYNDDDDDIKRTPSTPVVMAARAYQKEMLEESLKRNIILTMDTGSGKTQVAVMRIQTELERSHKLIWFLAPTVALASQQCKVIESHIPSVQVRLICGADNVNTWLDRTWDAILLNTRIVVSTYDILLEAAVLHRFVKLRSIGLIVFDEAHGCTGNSPGKRIMDELYWPEKRADRRVPHILGLTASPVVHFSTLELKDLERTLDAVCRGPTRHRDELMAHVNRPVMSIAYHAKAPEPTPSNGFTRNMLSVARAYQGLDIREDPFVLYLKAQGTDRSRERLKRALMKQDTYIQMQMRSFCDRSRKMWQQLGPWAADYYVFRVVHDFVSRQGPDTEPTGDSRDAEMQYLAGVFRNMDIVEPAEEPDSTSTKVRKLIRILLRFEGPKGGSRDEGKGKGKGEGGRDPVGIVFVQDRSTVAVLAHLLSRHPQLGGRFRVSSMVGTSSVPGRKQDFLDLSRRDNAEALERFRDGRVNLLAATSVLEEGIDVPACNLIICFDQLTQLKSFIQRRGRARMRESELHLLLEDTSTKTAEEWRAQENAMKSMYEDDQRALDHMREVEELEEDPDLPPIVAPSTGARLTVHDAKSHLEHFCQTLVSRRFVNSSPYYVIKSTPESVPAAPASMADEESKSTNDELGALRATVHLPISLAPELRMAESSRAWRSEKNACRDAALQAYWALYRAGLINERLLPLRESDLFPAVEPRAGLVNVREQLDPWPAIAQAWRASEDGKHHHRHLGLHRRDLLFTSSDGSARAQFQLVLPVPIPDLPKLLLHWDAHASWTVETVEPVSSFSPPSPFSPISSASASAATRPSPDDADATDDTGALISLAYGHRWPVRGDDHMVRFVCQDVSLSQRLAEGREFDAAVLADLMEEHLVREPNNADHPYFYAGALPSKPAREDVRHPYRGFDEAPQDAPYVAVTNWPKKAGYFRKPKPPPPVQVQADLRPRYAYDRVLPADQARIDGVPAVYARFGLLVPAIVHALEVQLVAAELQSMLRQAGSGGGVDLTDLSLVATAICTPAAREPTDYERIEFLGDSILKLCATGHCLATHPDWPEGYLSLQKDTFISNARLCLAARDFGLDRFIIAKGLALEKWRPRYVGDHLDPSPSIAMTRTMSTKTLADVVEALIGAAYLDGGLAKALACISLFLPHGKWETVAAARHALFSAAQPDVALPANMEPLEPLIGYSFRRKALLVEAMTHASFNGLDAAACLERLEFLGDAVLDHVVVGHLFAHADPAPLAHSDMHLLRTALVNGDFIGFLAMEWSLSQTRHEAVTVDNEERRSPRVETSEAQLPLWGFMRFSSPELGAVQRATRARHTQLRGRILAAMREGDCYPWALLARLGPPKVYSDVFESLLGAVWVDSGSGGEGDDAAGSTAGTAACEEVLERSGVLPYMRRLLRDRVRILHPREELGRLATSKPVEYQMEAHSREDEDGASGGGTGERLFSCRLTVKGCCVAQVDNCLNREEAGTRVAEEAIRQYHEQGGRWDVVEEEEERERKEVDME